MQTIQSIVRSEIKSFLENPVKVVDGYSFLQYENIKKIHLYTNGRFYSVSSNTQRADYPLASDVNEDDDRIFFQITNPRIKGVKRFFDVDTKDPVIDEIDPQSELALQFLNKDFQRFQEKYNLAKTYNEMADQLITYGSLVLDVGSKGEPQIVPLQNYFLDPTVKESKDSRFNTIKYTMTPKMLRDKVKDGWDKEAVESIIARMAKKTTASKSYEDDGSPSEIVSTSQIDVYKRYGTIPEYLLDPSSKSEEEVMSLTITAEPNATKLVAAQKGTQREEDQGVVLYKTEWTKDVPIVDTHLVKTHGRWQGIGVAELLFPIQQRMNEVANQKRISMEISALHLFQTADPTVLNNILTDLENGDVIKTKMSSAINPIVNEERNLPAFESELVTYSSQADKLSFANDLLSGGDVPTSTPATNVVVQNNNQVLVHLQDRENFTNFLANEYIMPFAVPAVINEMSDEHFLRFVSDPEDLLQIDDRIVNVKYNQRVIKDALEKGKVTTSLDKEDIIKEIREELRNAGTNRYTKILKDYYRDNIGDVFVRIGDEKRDVAKVANNTLSFFQMIQNPESLDDPVNRLFVTNYGRDLGIDTAKMELAFAKRESMREQQPNPVQAPKSAPAPEEDPALAEVL